MYRWDIINAFARRLNYNSYLEVGTQYPAANFDKINVPVKVSVDPFPMGEVSFVGTSDEYFASIPSDLKFDIIFIDGLHHSEQVLKDIENSLRHLSGNGTIVCHDCLPKTQIMQHREDHGGEWTGDVWKAIATLRVERTDLDIRVIDTDFGCGVIRRGVNAPHKPASYYTLYGYYLMNRNELMNVVSETDFTAWLNSI
jgi:hypothetical protein